MSVTCNSDADGDDDTEVECQNCGYVWMYSGELWNATCPRCNRKTKTPFHEDVGQAGDADG